MGFVSPNFNNHFLLRWIIIAALLGGLVSAKAYAVNIEKSPNDKREYAHAVLENGMKVVVVHDPKAIKTACSLEIDVGSYQEPDEFPGLAHFLEHMLFLGTSKYPETDQFQQIIHNNGGEFNAYTGGDRTHYYFNIQSKYFENTIDQFSEFFKSPLLTVELMDRERKNVDSEFKMYHNQDNWRMVDVNKETSNPKHPFHRFSVGNLKTLPDDKENLHKALKGFFETYYSADKMSLVFVGPQSTKELLGLAKKYFESITTKETPQIELLPLFTAEQLGKDIKIKAQGNSRQLMILFALPDFKENYREKPLHLLSQFLGYEGEGSLYAVLKSKGWITALVTSADTETSSTQNIINLTFYLTPMGLAHMDEITQYTFALIEMLKEKGFPKDFFSEIQSIHQLEFLYHERERETQLASRLAHNLQHYPVEEIITSGYLMADVLFEDSNKLLKQAIENMTHKTMRRFLISPDVVGNRESKWFSAHYSFEELPTQIKRADVKTIQSSGLKLPEPNPYIPENLAQQTHDQTQDPKKPFLLIDEKNFSLWFLNDAAFKNPKANININFVNQESMNSALNHMKSSLYAMLVLEQLKQTLYPAIMVGERINVNAHPRGLTVQIGGYSDKQAKILDTLVSALQNYQVNPVDFDLLKERLLRELKNYDQLPVFQQAIKGLNPIFVSPNWHPEESLQALKKISKEDLQKFKDDFIQNCQVEMLVNGNYSKQEAKNLAQHVTQHFKIDESAKKVGPLPEVFQLPKSKKYYKTIKASDKNHALAFYVQSHHADDASIAKAMILSKLLSTPFYQELRVNQHIGYALGAFVSLQSRVNGLIFFVQSPNVKPEEIYSAIFSFLDKFDQSLAQMNDQTISSIKTALVNELLDPPKTINEQTSRLWPTIESGRLDFELRNKVAKNVQATKIKDLKNYFEQLLLAEDAANLIVTTKMSKIPKDWEALDGWQSFKQKAEKFDIAKYTQEL